MMSKKLYRLCHESLKIIMSLTQKLEIELNHLADIIRTLDQFDQNTTVDVHALASLMRYCAWHDPQSFQAWLLSKTWTVNPGIVERIELFSNIKGLPNQKDGIEIRIHIFRLHETPYPKTETFKHTHKQDFITFCIQGKYRYRYFKVDSTDQSKKHVVFMRKNGIQTLLHSDKGVLKEGYYDDHDQWHFSEEPQYLNEGDLPIFVDSSYIHTVEHVSDEPIITFVARRGKVNEDTRVYQNSNDSDPRDENDTPPRPATEFEKQRIIEDLQNALLRDVHDPRTQTVWNDLVKYMMPLHHIPYLLDQEYTAQAQRNLISFMVVNRIDTLPLVNRDRHCTRLLCLPPALDDDESFQLQTIPAPLVVDKNEPLLFALLGMVINETLALPICDDQQQLIGLLTLSNLMRDHRKALATSLFWALYQQDRTDGHALDQVHELLQGLDHLYEMNQSYDHLPTQNQYHMALQSILSPLDELMIMIPDFDLGYLIDAVSYDTTPVTAQDLARFPFYCCETDHFDSDLPPSIPLILESLAACDFSQIGLRNAAGECQIISRDGTRKTVQALTGTQSFWDILSAIADGQWPIIVQNDYQELGIISSNELQTPRAQHAFYRELMLRSRLDLLSHPNIQRALNLNQGSESHDAALFEFFPQWIRFFVRELS